MPKVNDAWFHRLKAAQRDLIMHSGGIERAAEVASFSKSTVGRWNNPADSELMPPSAVYALETECGIPDFTSAMAGLHGCRMIDPESEGSPAGNLMAHYAESTRQAAALLAMAAQAFADGRVTPAEATAVDRAAANVETAMGELRRALAGTKAEGGFRVVGGEG